MSLSNLYCIILEEPINTFNQKFTQELFSKTISLRIDGYHSFHGASILPADSYDYISHILIFAEKSDHGYEPVQTIKYCSWSQAEKYNLEFQPIALSNDQIKETIYSLIRKEEEKNQLSYTSSLAYHPKFKNTLTGGKLAMAISGISYLFHKEYGIQKGIAAGAPELHTDRFFEKAGYHPVCKNPYFTQTSYLNKEVKMMKIEEWSEYAKKVAREWKAFWDNRIIVNKEFYQKDQLCL